MMAGSFALTAVPLIQPSHWQGLVKWLARARLDRNGCCRRWRGDLGGDQQAQAGHQQ